MQATTDFTPTTELLAGSPKMMYTYFLLQRAGKYLDAMLNQIDEETLETATASLLAFCPDVKKRDELFDNYVRRKQDPEVGKKTASILTIADFQAYLSEVLEFTEKSTGGF